MAVKVTGLIPMAHAADVQRAADFYQQGRKSLPHAGITAGSTR